jgi:uncharacterized DUF497 family protein
MRFDWSEEKNRINLRKHNIDFETAKLVFEDPYAVTQCDEVHDDEERFLTLGVIGPGATLLVSHTMFEEESEVVIRMISARGATAREKKAYEEAHKRSEAPDRRDRRQKRRGY